MSDLVPLRALDEIFTKHNALEAAKTAAGRGERIATLLVHGGEVAIGYSASSFVNSRFSAPGEDHIQIRGVPMDGLLGIAGVIGALAGWFGPMSNHVGFIAFGVALPALGRPLADLGMGQRLARDQLANQVASGQLPAKNDSQQAPAQQGSRVPSWAQR